VFKLENIEIQAEEIVVKEVYDTKSLPKHKLIQRRNNFSIILDSS